MPVSDLREAARALLNAMGSTHNDRIIDAAEALRAALAAEKERVSVPRGLHYELDGVIVDVEHGTGFDDVCLASIKRVRDTLADDAERVSMLGVILTGHELKDALEFVGDDLETEVCIQWFDACDGEEEPMESGYYVWLREYPEEGRVRLGPLAAAEKEPKECPPHEWSKDGERCVKCGDKDWM